MLTKIKKKVETLLSSNAVRAQKLGLSPNRISFLGLIFATLSALAYWLWRPIHLMRWIAPAFLMASGFCDAFDGVVARVAGSDSPSGAFLDSLLDRYEDAAILIGIISGGLCLPIFGLLALMGSLIVSYTRARAEAEGVGMESVGVFERAERLLLIFVASIINIFFESALNYTVALLALLTNVTVIQRTIHFIREVSERKKP